MGPEAQRQLGTLMSTGTAEGSRKQYGATSMAQSVWQTTLCHVGCAGLLVSGFCLIISCPWMPTGGPEPPPEPPLCCVSTSMHINAYLALADEADVLAACRLKRAQNTLATLQLVLIHCPTIGLRTV